jgi:hypothetical protein
MLIEGRYSPPPGQIANLSAAAVSDTEIQLTFTDSPNAVSHQYRLDGGTATTLDGDRVIDGLNPSQAYDIEVRGFKTENLVGAWSNLVTETTDAASGAPIVANQTIYFGRLTAIGAGKVELAHTGGSITSITLGTRTTGSDHFTTSAEHVQPSTVPADASYVWTGCTATGPGGTSSTFTLTITTVADAYSVQSTTEFNAAITAIGTAASGARSILARPSTFTAVTISSKNFSNIVTVTRHTSQVANPVFTSFSLNNAHKVTFDDIEVYNPSSGFCFSIIGGSSNIVVNNCDVHGLFYDTTADYSAGAPVQPYFISGSGGTAPVSLTFTNNQFYDSLGMSITASSSVVFTGNTVYNCYHDTVKIGGTASGFPTVTVTGNTLYNVYGNPTDAGNPHPDFIQFLGFGAVSTGSMVATVSDNTIVGFYGARGAAQLIFSDNFTAGSYLNLTCENNLAVGFTAGGIRINQADTCVIRNNTIVRNDYGTGASTLFDTAIIVGTTGTTGTHVAENNVAEGISLAGSPTLTNNILVHRDGTGSSPYAYTTAFDGIAGAFRPASVSDAVTMFQPKAAGPLDVTPVVGFTGP